MLNQELLLKTNSNKKKQKIKIASDKRYVYKTKTENINIKELKRVLDFLAAIKKRHKLSLLPLVIDLGKKAIIEDKLTYMLLECLIYDLIVNEKCDVSLFFNFPHTIYNEGIKTSCLTKIDGTKEGFEKFEKHFRSEIYGKHYRKIIKIEDFAGGEIISRTVQEIDSFLKICGIHSDYSKKASDIVGELIDNALDHSNSDCFVDIDVTKDYGKINDSDPDGLYCGVNIVVLNFSDILLGEGIAKKLDMISGKSKELNIEINKRYFDVIEAKKLHSAFWCDAYCEDDFNVIASFQHKISSRLSRTGGTGLTQLINGLEEASDDYNCYLLSGNRKYNLLKDKLVHNEENWVGFNTKKDFLSCPPDFDCFEKSGIFFPGSAYNLNFVMKREVN